MSRIIIKNLPSKCTEVQIRKFFKSYEPITDVSLKYTADGKFRKFAFVGFSDEEKCSEVISKFNNTFFGTSKVVVEECAPIQEKYRIRPWSKYSKGSSAYKRIHGDELTLEGSSVKRTKLDPVLKYKHDEQFNTFLKVRGLKNEDEEKSEDESGTTVLLNLLNSFKGDKTVSLLFRGLPVHLKQTNLQEWLSPIKMKSCILTRSSDETFAAVTFNKPADLKKALKRTDQFLGGFKVKICKFPNEEKVEANDEKTVDIDVEQERKKMTDKIMDTGRLFLRNLPYICTESDLTLLFKTFGELVDVQCVVNRQTGQCKGFGIVTFMFPENALAAYTALDGTVFKGRMLHILPGEEKPESSDANPADSHGLSGFQRQKDAKKKSNAGQTYSWNTLFMGSNAVADTLAEKLNMDKSQFLEDDAVNSAAVRMSLAETRLVLETRKFLEENGVQLDVFSRPTKVRSQTVIIVKNLPSGADPSELIRMFERFGELKRFLLPPECKVTALVEFKVAADAKKAFISLAYSKYKTQPLYLEWAPQDVFKPSVEEAAKEEAKTEPLSRNEKRALRLERKYGSNLKPVAVPEDGDVETSIPDSSMEPIKPKEDSTDESTDAPAGKTLFVKNLNFNTNEENLTKVFKKSKVESLVISKKAEKTNNGVPLSMGFGFITFNSKALAEDALRTMQGTLVDGHAIELSRARRADPNAQSDTLKRRVVEKTEQGESTKLLVRNIPFQASEKEVRSLFTAFGEIKSLRLPRKVASGQHRGFAFVDFSSKTDAQSAFESLVHSTHLYGRRLVLEWANNEESVDEIRERTAKTFNRSKKGASLTRRQIRGVVQEGMESASKE